MIKVPLGYFCSREHAMLYGKSKAKDKQEKAIRARAKKDKADKKESRKKLAELKESLKTKSDYTKIAQTEFNKYINLRDRGKPCISCNRPLVYGVRSRGEKGGVDASHYRSRGAAPHLRFDLRNCHSSCIKCNRDLSGNIVEYRKGLIARYGVEYVESIESDQRSRHYSRDDLKRIASIFRRRSRHYKKLRENK